MYHGRQDRHEGLWRRCHRVQNAQPVLEIQHNNIWLDGPSCLRCSGQSFLLFLRPPTISLLFLSFLFTLCSGNIELTFPLFFLFLPVPCCAHSNGKKIMIHRCSKAKATTTFTFTSMRVDWSFPTTSSPCLVASSQMVTTCVSTSSLSSSAN